MATPCPKLALGCTIAVGWTVTAMSEDFVKAGVRALLINDHRGVGRLSAHHTVNLGLTLELPDIAALVDALDMNPQRIARADHLPEPGILDRHEIDQAAFDVVADRVDHKSRRGLRHRFDDQNAGHDRLSGEMALEVWFVGRHVLDPDRAVVD